MMQRLTLSLLLFLTASYALAGKHPKITEHSAADEKPVNPAADEKPVNPAADEKPVNPAADEKPVNPAADEKPVNPAADEKPVAIVARASGTAESAAGGGSWTAVKRGTELSAQTKVRTGDKSSVTLLFTDGSVVRVDAKAEVLIKGERGADGTYTKRELAVTQGGIGFDVKATKSQTYKFTSPTSVAAIKGTQGTFEIGEDGDELALVDSESKEKDIADLTNTSTQATESIGIGEAVSLTRAGALERRKLRQEELQELKRRIVEYRMIREAEILIRRMKIRKDAEERRNR